MDLPKTSAPAERALASINVRRLEDLTQFTEKEVADLHGMGPKVLGTLKQALTAKNLRFKR